MSDELLPTPAKIGVALAVLAAIFILTVPLLFIYRRRKRRQTLRSAQALRRQTLDLNASPAASLVFNRHGFPGSSDLPYTPSPISPDDRSPSGVYYDRTPDTASVEMIHVQPAVTVTVPKAGLLRAKSPSRRSTPTSPTSPSTSRPRTADRRSSASASPVASRPGTSGSVGGWTRTSSDKRLSHQLRPGGDKLHPDLEAALQRLEREQHVQDVSPRPYYIPTIAPPAPVATAALSAAQRSHSQPQIPASPSRGTLRRSKRRPPPSDAPQNLAPPPTSTPTPMPRSASAPDASLAPHPTYKAPPTSFTPITSTAPPPPSSFTPITSYVTPPTPTTPTTMTTPATTITTLMHSTSTSTTVTPKATPTPIPGTEAHPKPRKKPSRTSSDIIPSTQPPPSPKKARVSRSQSLAMHHDHGREPERERGRDRAKRMSARPAI